MLIVAFVVTALALGALVAHHRTITRKLRVEPIAVIGTLLAFAVAAATVLGGATRADAAIVATVPMGTAANYSVLGGQTVTNNGFSILNQSLGLSPGTSITGFPPGIVNPPATTDQTNAAAAQAQADLTVAYVNAATRPITEETVADLANLQLVGGVYATSLNGALELNGPLVLDGQGNVNSVFIFQTNSTLLTGSASTVSLINGAQACNVFWQVGSSATLGSSSVFVGNILALDSITLGNEANVEGRALARNAAVTLDDNTFTAPACAQPTQRQAPVGDGPPELFQTETPPTAGDTPSGSATGGVAATPGSPVGSGTPAGGGGTTGIPGGPGTPGLPATGLSSPNTLLTFALFTLALGTVAVIVSRRRPHPAG